MQTINFKAGRNRILCLLIITALNIHGATGQVALEATVSNPAPAAGELFDVVVTVLTAIDFYYAEMEVIHDPKMLEFADIAKGTLAGEGIHMAGELEPGRTGVSVSRTTPLEAGASGSVMIMTFRVLENAAGGDTEIIFSDLLILDSEAEQVPSGLPVPVHLTIETNISILQLLIPAENTIEEGNHFPAGAMVYAAGVQDDQRLICQAGVGPPGTGPASWSEDAWLDMTYTGMDGDGNFTYTAEVAGLIPAGEWRVAVRSSLDGGEYVYGGPDGILDGTGSLPASLTILPRPQFRYSLAHWDFDHESMLPSVSISANREAAVQISGAAFDGFSAGYSGQALNSRNWAPAGGGLCYWLVEFSTRGFVELEVSSRQYGSGTGPRDFLLEYSLDGFVWNAVEEGVITVAGNWTSGRLDRVPLPENAEDMDRVLLRWINTSDISVNGAVTGTSGTSRIDDILITGINPDPQQAIVYPGDANNDGTVNADDVLPLGLYWLSSGPSSVWEEFGFVARGIEQWIPPGATWADTNGDGIVDHRDLLAIGLHFGKTAGPVKKDTVEPLSSIIVDPLKGGHRRLIMVESAAGLMLRGVAVSLEVAGIPPDMWKIGRVVPEFAEGTPEKEVLPFAWTGDNVFEAAFTLKGYGDDLPARNMVGFELLIDEQWSDAFTLYLNRFTVSSDNSAGKALREGGLVFTETLSSVPDTRENRVPGLDLKCDPNPFSGITAISFNLDASSYVRLELATIDGRTVATPFSGSLEVGSHRILFDGSFLPAGVYLCILTTPQGSRQVVRLVRMP